MGTMVLPSVKASTDTSGPGRGIPPPPPGCRSRRRPGPPSSRGRPAWPPRRVSADDHALAQRQAVGLDDGGIAGRCPDVGERFVRLRQTPRRRRWGCRISSSSFLAKTLLPSISAAFVRGAESRRCPPLLSASTAPSDQRIVRRHHGKVDAVCLGKGHHAVDVLGRRWARSIGVARPCRRCRAAQ